MSDNEFELKTTLYEGYINVEKRTDGGIGIYVNATKIDCGTLMLTKYEALQLAKWLVQYLVK